MKKLLFSSFAIMVMAFTVNGQNVSSSTLEDGTTVSVVTVGKFSTVIYSKKIGTSTVTTTEHHGRHGKLIDSHSGVLDANGKYTEIGDDRNYHDFTYYQNPINWHVNAYNHGAFIIGNRRNSGYGYNNYGYGNYGYGNSYNCSSGVQAYHNPRRRW